MRRNFVNRHSLGPLVVIVATGLFEVLLASLAWHAVRGDTMKTSITYRQLDSFWVIGISARTTNDREEGPAGIIPKLRQRFFQDGVRDKIPNKIGGDIYAVYTAYAGDHHGEYTYIVGTKVKPGTAPPAGLVSVEVPAGSYAVLTTEQGPLRQVVPTAWKSVFGLEDEGKLRRAYRTDFELYDQRSENPEDAQVDIFLGIK